MSSAPAKQIDDPRWPRVDEYAARTLLKGDPALDAAIADIGAALTAGALTELPVRRFPLGEIAAAHEAAEGGAVGKVIVTP